MHLPTRKRRLTIQYVHEWPLNPTCKGDAREQDRQCTYNLTLRGVHRTTVVVEKQVLHIRLCVHACACVHLGTWARGRMHAPYCDVICGPSVSTTFFDIIS
jgi:hypothetical protein